MANTGVSGTLSNMAKSGRVWTPATIAEQMMHVLLTVPTDPYTVLDPCVGRGDLLKAFAASSDARCVGIDISQEQIGLARQYVPSAELVCSPIEHVRLTEASISLLVNNPPYIQVAGGTRMELEVTRRVTAAIQPGGVLLLIVPARSAIDGWLGRLLVQHYEQLRCWRFPDGEFESYSQVIIAGYRRSRSLADTDMEHYRHEVDQVKAWRYHPTLGTWGARSTDRAPAPDVLPDVPIENPYVVPAAIRDLYVELVRASEDDLFASLQRSGGWREEQWQRTTAYSLEPVVERPAMPISGMPHLAALLLQNLLAHQVHRIGGRRTLISAYITQRTHGVPVGEEDQKKGVVHILQTEDHPTLRVLDVEDGSVATYEGGDVYAFLSPHLAELSTVVLDKVPPLYALDPDPWQVQVATLIGQDKQLPGMDRGGLADAQLERVFALYRLLDVYGKAAIQGTPGTGKTRQTIALFAQMVYRWHQRDDYFKGQAYPKWLRRSLKAWKNNPHTRQLAAEPRAVPFAISAPKRTTESTWQEETTEAWWTAVNQDWPGVEVMHIKSWSDVDRWMQRCAVSDAVAVVAIFPHSLNRAGGTRWEPSVRVVEVPGKFSEEVVLGEDGKIERDSQGRPVRRKIPLGHFYCPSCGNLIKASPGREKKDRTREEEQQEELFELLIKSTEKDQKVKPVTSITYFWQEKRACRECDSPLWQEQRTPVRQSKYAMPTYQEWTAALPTVAPAIQYLPRDRYKALPDSQRDNYVARAADERMTITVRPGPNDAPTYERGPLPPSSFSPFAYWKRKYSGICVAVVVDESHNARTEGTDIRQGMHDAFRAAQTHVMLSGTHYGGMFELFFHYWFTFDAALFRKLGFGWTDVKRAAEAYGVTQDVTVQVASKANAGTGAMTELRNLTRSAPGIAARLLPYLLGKMPCIDVLDVGAFMPPRKEIPVLVSMDDPSLRERLDVLQCEYNDVHGRWTTVLRQLEHELGSPTETAQQRVVQRHRITKLQHERDELHPVHEQIANDLAAMYKYVEARDQSSKYWSISRRLEELSMNRVAAATLQKGTLPSLWSVLGMTPEAFTITTNKRDDWGNVIEQEKIFQAPVLAWDYIYPLERRLQEIVRDELDRQQVIMIYVGQAQKRSMAERIKYVLQSLDLTDGTIYVLPDKVKSEDREDAIRTAVKVNGARIIIANYLKLMEGLNLQFVDAIIWYEMAKNPQSLEQASRRAWRLGATTEKRIYYMALTGTTAHAKLKRLGAMGAAGALFAGEDGTGTLAKLAGADKGMLQQLASELVVKLGQPDEADVLAAQFEARNEELAQQLRAGRKFIGMETRLPSLRAEMVSWPSLPTVRPAPMIIDIPVQEVIDMTQPEPEPVEPEATLVQSAAQQLAERLRNLTMADLYRDSNPVPTYVPPPLYIAACRWKKPLPRRVVAPPPAPAPDLSNPLVRHIHEQKLRNPPHELPWPMETTVLLRDGTRGRVVQALPQSRQDAHFWLRYEGSSDTEGLGDYLISDVLQTDVELDRYTYRRAKVAVKDTFLSLAALSEYVKRGTLPPRRHGHHVSGYGIEHIWLCCTPADWVETLRAKAEKSQASAAGIESRQKRKMFEYASRYWTMSGTNECYELRRWTDFTKEEQAYIDRTTKLTRHPYIGKHVFVKREEFVVCPAKLIFPKHAEASQWWATTSPEMTLHHLELPTQEDLLPMEYTWASVMPRAERAQFWAQGGTASQFVEMIDELQRKVKEEQDARKEQLRLQQSNRHVRANLRDFNMEQPTLF